MSIIIINTWCILITEAVTVSNVIAIASLVFEIWLAHTDRHRHRHRHTDTRSTLKFAKSLCKQITRSFWLTNLQVIIPGCNGGNSLSRFCLQNSDGDVRAGDDRCPLVAINFEVHCGVAHSRWSTAISGCHRELGTHRAGTSINGGKL